MDQLDNLRAIPDIGLFWLVTAQVLPFIMAVINRAAWPSFLKWTTVTAACFVASFLYFLIQQDGFDGWTWRNWMTFALWIAAGTGIFYKIYSGAVKNLEAKTG